MGNWCDVTENRQKTSRVRTKSGLPNEGAEQAQSQGQIQTRKHA